MPSRTTGPHWRRAGNTRSAYFHASGARFPSDRPSPINYVRVRAGVHVYVSGAERGVRVCVALSVQFLHVAVAVCLRAFVPGACAANPSMRGNHVEGIGPPEVRRLDENL